MADTDAKIRAARDLRAASDRTGSDAPLSHQVEGPYDSEAANRIKRAEAFRAEARFEEAFDAYRDLLPLLGEPGALRRPLLNGLADLALALAGEPHSDETAQLKRRLVVGVATFGDPADGLVQKILTTASAEGDVGYAAKVGTDWRDRKLRARIKSANSLRKRGHLQGAMAALIELLPVDADLASAAVQDRIMVSIAALGDSLMGQHRCAEMVQFADDLDSRIGETKDPFLRSLAGMVQRRKAQALIQEGGGHYDEIVTACDRALDSIVDPDSNILKAEVAAALHTKAIGLIGLSRTSEAANCLDQCIARFATESLSDPVLGNQVATALLSRANFSSMCGLENNAQKDRRALVRMYRDTKDHELKEKVRTAKRARRAYWWKKLDEEMAGISRAIDAAGGPERVAARYQNAVRQLKRPPRP